MTLNRPNASIEIVFDRDRAASKLLPMDRSVGRRNNPAMKSCNRSAKHKLQKAMECRHLERFRRVYRPFPDGDLEMAEAPDFIIHQVCGSVGIDVTRLLSADTHQRATESERYKAVRNASRLYSSRDLPPAAVSVHWLPHYHITRRRRLELEAFLANLVVAFMPEDGGSLTIENLGPSESPLPAELQYVEIDRIPGLTENAWISPDFGWVASLSPEQVQETITAKEAKLEAYRQRCTAAWLLLVLEGLRPSSLFSIPAGVVEATYQTCYDNVLLLQYFEGQVVELRITPLPLGASDAPLRRTAHGGGKLPSR